MQPETIVYDVDLTLGLPLSISATSAVNAMAHAAEALYAPERSPLVRTLALESLGSLASGLARVRESLSDPDGRESLLYGAWLAGTCLAAAPMGLHHKLSHVLGGMYDLPHAPLHTVLLPYVLDFNESAAHGALSEAAQAMDHAAASRSAAVAVRRLVESVGGPTSLGELGLRPGDITGAVEQALGEPYPEPACRVGSRPPRPPRAGTHRRATRLTGGGAGAAPDEARPDHCERRPLTRHADGCFTFYERSFVHINRAGIVA